MGGVIFDEFLNIIPVPKARPRFSRFRVYTPKKTAQYERLVKRWMQQNMAARPSDAPLHVTVEFIVPRGTSVTRAFPTVRGDLDNLLKSVLDAGNGVIWKDDAQIISLKASKLYQLTGLYQLVGPPGVSLTVSEVQ